MTRFALRAAALAAPVYLAACAVPSGGLFRGARFRDLRVYREVGDALLEGRVPYRDFAVEYPPGAIPLFTAPSLAPGVAYDALFKGLTAAVGIATIFLVCLALARLGASRPLVLATGLFLALMPIALGPVSLNTYDAWPAALVAGALCALVFERPALAFALLGAGFALKLYPLLLVPLALVAVGRARAPRAVLAFVATAATLVLPWLALSPGGVLDALEAQLGRGLHAESLGAGLLMAADRLGWYDATVVATSDGAVSRDLVGALPDALAHASSALVLLATGAVVAAAWWRARPSDNRSRAALAAGFAATVAAAVAFSKVLSPQYLVWLIPLVPLAGSAVAAVVLVAALALAQSWYFDYPELWAVGDEAWTLAARDLLLVVLYALLLRKTAMPSSWKTSTQAGFRRKRTSAADAGIGANRSA